MAFGAEKSFSSHYVPQAMLLQAGVQISDLKGVAFLDRHERVALAVVHGDYDAGGVRKEIAELYLQRGDGLRIVATSPPLPPHVIVARSDLDYSVIARVRQALLAPDSKGLASFRTLLGEGTRFAPVRDEQFNMARRLLRNLDAVCPDSPSP
jgi:phosphonate transport system substrate-binding protein